jgi:hypothetical protein
VDLAGELATGFALSLEPEFESRWKMLWVIPELDSVAERIGEWGKSCSGPAAGLDRAGRREGFSFELEEVGLSGSETDIGWLPFPSVGSFSSGLGASLLTGGQGVMGLVDIEVGLLCPVDGKKLVWAAGGDPSWAIFASSSLGEVIAERGECLVSPKIGGLPAEFACVGESHANDESEDCSEKESEDEKVVDRLRPEPKVAEIRLRVTILLG